MPRYTYRCEECGGVFNVAHSLKEKLTDCEECPGSLTRVPSLPYIFSSELVKDGGDVGGRVKKYISDAKEELEKTKRESQKEHE